VGGALGEGEEAGGALDEGEAGGAASQDGGEQVSAPVAVAPPPLPPPCLSAACLNRERKEGTGGKRNAKTNIKRKIFTFSQTKRKKMSLFFSYSLALPHALAAPEAGTGAPTTLISHSDATRLTKCASAVLVDACTRKTSSARTGE